jgi:hypothetical protein
VSVGDRAPDVELLAPHGGRTRLHRLLGERFVAVTFTDVRTDAPVAREVPDGLEHVLVSNEDAPVDSPFRDRTYYDLGGAAAARFGAAPGTTYLIRPDDYVAAVEPAGGAAVTRLFEAALAPRG